MALRGGAYKPRSSPYAFQGLQEEGLQYLAEARGKTGLAVVTEVMSENHVAMVGEYADCYQVGASNMQNYLLLKAVGQAEELALPAAQFHSGVEVDDLHLEHRGSGPLGLFVVIALA